MKPKLERIINEKELGAVSGGMLDVVTERSVLDIVRDIERAYDGVPPSENKLFQVYNRREAQIRAIIPFMNELKNLKNPNYSSLTQGQWSLISILQSLTMIRISSYR